MHNLSQTFPKPKRTLRTTDASGYRTTQEQGNQFPAVCINKRVKKKAPCIYMWCQVDHPVIWVVPALGFVTLLGNFTLMHFGCTTSKVRHLFSYVMSSGGAVMSCVMSRCCMCMGHMTFCYKRSTDALFEALLVLFSSFGSWFIHQVHPCHLCTAAYACRSQCI